TTKIKASQLNSNDKAKNEYVKGLYITKGKVPKVIVAFRSGEIVTVNERHEMSDLIRLPHSISTYCYFSEFSDGSLFLFAEKNYKINIDKREIEQTTEFRWERKINDISFYNTDTLLISS